jgi:hypothetical protein
VFYELISIKMSIDPNLYKVSTFYQSCYEDQGHILLRDDRKAYPRIITYGCENGGLLASKGYAQSYATLVRYRVCETGALKVQQSAC